MMSSRTESNQFAGANVGLRRTFEIGAPFAIAVILLLIASVFSPSFAHAGHILTMCAVASYVGIIGIGQTLVILTGGIDLSIPYVLNFAATLLTGLTAAGVSGGLSVPTVLAVGAVIGILNGIGISVFRIPPLVMTLGMNSILEGLTLLYTKGTPAGSAPSAISSLAAGRIAGFPNTILLWIILAILVTVLLVRTTLGRSIYAVGSSSTVTWLSGISVKSTLIIVYSLSGLFAALGGLLLTGYSGQSYIGMGDSMLLPSVAIVAIGGTSILGGKGTYIGTVGGALTITFLESWLTTVNLSESARDVIYGVVILGLLYVNQRTNRSRQTGE